MKRLNILVSAFVCLPYKGSELGVGWNVVTRLVKYHDVMVSSFRRHVGYSFLPDHSQSYPPHFFQFQLNRNHVNDRPIDIYEWVDAFSMALRSKHARRVPRCILRMIGYVGDVASAMGLKFPLTSSRYHSMTENYLTPMDQTFDVFGAPPMTLQAGVMDTVKWLKEFNGRESH